MAEEKRRTREWVGTAFSRFEDVVYVGLGLILAYGAGALLVTSLSALWQSAFGGAPQRGILDLLDRALLILMFVELLYTVQVSFRSHELKPEPFLVVGLIAAVRRILVVTAEFSQMVEKPEAVFRRGMTEVALLTAMVLALVSSLWVLRHRAGADGAQTPAERLDKL